MRAIKPKQYIDEFYPGSGLTTATIRNWLRKGKIPGVRTPTGNWLVVIENNQPSSKVEELLSFLED
ncbi:hypothetical protein [Vibrio quintilis]|uniref:Uncharacterized protein n=1 Tax=Vibrio quintilis TaxID=1117707 RepID=A0A1M7YP57_9VIBR|nr:hypothetical protein [Vibrio quintilis]SHO54365.1 hypothetical protein VQ7734_00079 [Vibrio quintilis]